MKKHNMCYGYAAVLFVTVVLTRAKSNPLSGITSNKSTRILVPAANLLSETTEIPRIENFTLRPHLELAPHRDGNHPDIFTRLTHEEIDTSSTRSESSKRVKKILPPFPKFKRSSAKIQMKIESFRPAVVDELLVTEIKQNGSKNELRSDDDRKIGTGKINGSPLNLPTAVESIQITSITENGAIPVGHTDNKEERTKTKTGVVVGGSSIADDEYVSHTQAPSVANVFSLPPTSLEKARGANTPHQTSTESFENKKFSAEQGETALSIEQHPYLYANSWQQLKDTELELGGEDEGESPYLSSKSVPSLAIVSSNEELTIPSDVSHFLKSSSDSGGGEKLSQAEEPAGRVKNYLLHLTGNATIVEQRWNDFTKYLRLNLAARLSVEYDDVKVNKLVITQRHVLANISIIAPSDDIAEESQIDLKEKLEGEVKLSELAENNATILELSGEEYRVERFLTLPAPKWAAQTGEIPKAQHQYDQPYSTFLNSRHEDIEFIIYTFLGSACACAVMLTLFLAFNKYGKKLNDCSWHWKRSKKSRPVKQECEIPVAAAVIYSGGLPQIRGSWMSGRDEVGVRHDGNSSKANPQVLQMHLTKEMNSEQMESPRHNKLRMYNCQPDRVLVRKPPSTTA